MFAQTAINPIHSFFPTSEVSYEDKAWTKLLSYIVRGKQNKAERFIQKPGNARLLLKKGDVTDHAGRNLIDVTAFQCALWAKDTHMWQMIRKYLPEDAQKQQLDELLHPKKGISIEWNGMRYEHQHAFDLSVYIAALKEACKREFEHYNGKREPGPYDFDARMVLFDKNVKSYWLTRVASMQRQLPIVFIQEYCCLTRTLDERDPCLFLEETFERTLMFYNPREKTMQSWWDELACQPDENGRFSYALYRGRACVNGANAWDCPSSCVYDDIKALTKLDRIRTAQIEKLYQAFYPNPLPCRPF